MLIVLFLIILALLPLAVTQAFPHLLMVSIYAGVFPWLALAWAAFWITIVLRQKRIREWRNQKRIRKSFRNE
jgi:hypothetical protein